MQIIGMKFNYIIIAMAAKFDIVGSGKHDEMMQLKSKNYQELNIKEINRITEGDIIAYYEGDKFSWGGKIIHCDIDTKFRLVSGKSSFWFVDKSKITRIFLKIPLSILLVHERIDDLIKKMEEFSTRVEKDINSINLKIKK